MTLTAVTVLFSYSVQHDSQEIVPATTMKATLLLINATRIRLNNEMSQLINYMRINPIRMRGNNDLN